MTKRSLLIGMGLGIGALLWMSCEREEAPDLTTGDVVFYMQGKLDGEELRLDAGEEDYYMHTDFDHDSLQIYSFIGTLGHKNCTNTCPGSFTLYLRDNQASASDLSNVDRSLKNGTYVFRAPADSLLNAFKVAFDGSIFSKNDNELISWDFGDGHGSNLPNPVHYYDPQGSTTVNACLTVSSPSQLLSSKLCNEINLLGDCYADFTYGFSNGKVSLVAQEKGAAPFQYLWDLGNGFLPLSMQTNHDFTGLDSARICLEVTDANSCRTVMCKNAIIDSNNVEYAANFSYTRTVVSIPDYRDFSEVTLEYIDESGKIYRSSSFGQPNESYFQILGVSSYDNNASGNPTKQLDISLRCRLYGDSENDFVELTDVVASFAVAHP